MEIEILNQEKMDNYNFTKGKWEYLYDGCDHCYDIVSDNSSICSTVSLDRISFDTDKEIEANALLISKAPEMLEMLKKCKMMCDHLNIHHVSNELNTLIKEATEL